MIFSEIVLRRDTTSLCLLVGDGSFWGCGSNKYGQLGELQQSSGNPCSFIKLDTQLLDSKTVKKFKCHEWGTAIITE